ncbi:MAG: S8 family peptidase [Chloroflexota bacterium]
MARKRARVQADVAGAPPEQVLVLEVAGSIENFFRAVQLTPGAELLAEIDETLEPDADFYRDEQHPDAEIAGQLFLVLSDQQALNQIQSLWRRWVADPTQRFDRGLAPWRHVFAQLRDIRPWDERDRVAGTGIIEDWNDRLAQGQQSVPAEVELWFRASPEDRRAAGDRIRQLIVESGGEPVSETEISEIAYHGLLAILPADLIPQVVETREARLVRADDIMFLRPTGQAFSPAPDDEPLLLDDEERERGDVARLDPIVALFDGLPLENHAALLGRLRVDDPDGWAEAYPARDRVHGTAMASLICCGDLDANEVPLERSLYTRPIMRPGSRDFDGSRAECVPDNELFVDLVERSVRRLFVAGANDADPVAPTVRIINLSICERALPLRSFPSPIARLLDWLSWQHGVLFTVSAGNHATDFTFASTMAEMDALNPAEVEALTLRSLIDNAVNRRLLAPAESINALTIGAAHADAYAGALSNHHRNLIESPRLPSPLNALGLGFRRTVKPDVLLAGGRQLYEDAGLGGGQVRCAPVRSSRAPGQKAAAPGAAEGDVAAARYSRGTSNATARATRQLSWLYDNVVRPMRTEIGHVAEAPLLKALLVHAASWDDAADRLSPLLADVDRRIEKDHCARLLGYGAVDETRLGGGTTSRAVLVGTGSLTEDLGHVYSIPLPPSLSGQRVWRRVTVTLAWMSPINPRHRSYRRAQLWFDAPRETVGVGRVNAQWQTVRRGTLQHEVLEGETAAAFADGDTFDIRVNCKADAGDLAEEVPYALAVTLEVAPLLEVSIYDEIEARIRPRVAVAPRA